MRITILSIGLVAALAGCAQPRGGGFAALDRRLDAREGEEQESAPRATRTSHPSRGDAAGADSVLAVSSRESAWADDGTQADGAENGGSEGRGPLPDFSDTLARDVRAMPGDLWDDTKAVYGRAPNLLILGLTYGGSLALQETGPDDSIEDSYRHNQVLSGGSREAFNFLGHPGLHFALAGSWYLFGQTTQNDRTYEVAKTLFSALIINGLSTMTGQLASWDRAPNGEWGTFPSGHTSSTFTLASVMHDAYGPLVGVPLYGLGVLVAMSRLEDGEHYFSDVVMGGVMGLVIGHTVSGEHDLELFGGKILPFADPNTGSSGIAWVKELKFRK